MGLSKYFLSEAKPELNQEKLDYIVRHALIEDIGRGDITTQLTIPKDKKIEANIIAKESCVVCGIQAAEKVFKITDSAVKFKPLTKEGQVIKAGKAIARISGQAASILSSERVALNLLSMLSGIASTTREYVEHIEPYAAKITDTRKTLPGLRDLQKYAVRVGGGHNHRMGLDEMILIKDNHIKVTEGYEKLPSVPKGFKIEIEVQNLDEFRHALHFKPDVIMLDNMSFEDIKEAVKIRNNTEFKSHHPPTKLEASGGVDSNTVRKIASTGVDIISIGALTNSVKAIDMSLEVS
ncbi:MAG: nicotinate-nucleotide diphosphorylase (carboxylating) [Candidatus Omnitrophica bacterium CG08_land_8_20_14_0_20_41_16]|uniref:Probable nicotinate-nucleotide pyrophosphorylase [carboxylating] n=1 Tax=Candidatus Sherwoodlollariibacterium unditelluris TaxID=1974757 RepID=A0A2G9YIJ5_9BACT|nr:MAG: nicotinate-nucleotide diphosphorylase (carboxylating) [Candidatus Omnitrophica bacterium CG23_combo_of_CG06-09_8_20_14_all_41_10]PIS34179.1 MAG: nicotinate-nucleotide diphosphorylase (carboxylating) [Candidatus Omnitrophica bacterium CG08_land_8_20_14_0_20_41_16]